MHAKITAIYVGAFDPLTNGHFDIISRASQIFDRLVVAIGQNPSKQSTFTGDERKAMVEAVCRDLPQVEVTTFSGLAVDHAVAVGASVMVRGLRTEADYVYEMQMAMMNRTLNNKLETLFIPTRQDLSHISSSLVKDVTALGGNTSKLVPALVFQKLTERILNK